MTPDYAEILRLYLKYRARDDEPLWVTFVMIGQQLENSKPKSQRCPKCHRTDIEFERATEGMGLIPCGDPWHADDNLRRTPQHSRPHLSTPEK